MRVKVCRHHHPVSDNEGQPDRGRQNDTSQSDFPISVRLTVPNLKLRRHSARILTVTTSRLALLGLDLFKSVRLRPQEEAFYRAMQRRKKRRGPII